MTRRKVSHFVLLGVLAMATGRIPVVAQDEVPGLPERAVFRLGDHRLHHRSSIQALSYSPDERYLAAAGKSPERGVRLWDATTGEQVAYLVADGPESSWNRAIAFSSDGKNLLAGDVEGRLVIWDIDLRSPIKVFQSDGNRRITAVAFSPDGAIFATGDDDGTVTVRLTRDPGAPLWVHAARHDVAAARKKEEPGGLVALQFTPTGNELVAALGRSATILVFQPDNGAVLSRFDRLHGIGSSASGNVPLISISISPDGRSIVTSGSRYVPRGQVPPEFTDLSSVSGDLPVAEVRVWELQSGDPIQDLMGDRLIRSCGYSALAPDGSCVAVASFSGIDLISTETGDVVRSLPLPRWWGSRPFFSGDGTMLAAAVGRTIALWDVAAGARLLIDRPAHGGPVSVVSCSPDGQSIATADHEGQLHVWNAETGEHAWEASFGDGASIHQMQYSGDGRLLVAGNQRDPQFGRLQPIVNIWSADGRLLTTLHPDRAPCGVAVSPDGSRLAAAHTSGALGRVHVDLWQIDPPAKLAHFPRDAKQGISRYNAMTFSADGRFVLTAEYNGAVARWDTSPAAADQSFAADSPSGARQAAQRAPWVGEAVFSSDGALLVTSTNENLHLWGAVSGTLRGTLTVPEAPRGFRIALSPDSRLLAASEVLYAGEPGSDVIRILDLETRQVVLTLTPVDARAMSLAFSPDNQRLITGLDNGTAMVWDLSR